MGIQLITDLNLMQVLPVDPTSINPAVARITSACPKTLSGARKRPQDSRHTTVYYMAQNMSLRMSMVTFLHKMHNLCTTTMFLVPYAV